jgi:hypothetical protein
MSGHAARGRKSRPEELIGAQVTEPRVLRGEGADLEGEAYLSAHHCAAPLSRSHLESTANRFDAFPHAGDAERGRDAAVTDPDAVVLDLHAEVPA